VRLVDFAGRVVAGGKGTVFGRLEVWTNSAWGSVCENNFGLADAAVACREMGHFGGEPLVSFEIPPFKQKLPPSAFQFCSGTPPRCLLASLSGSASDDFKLGNSFYALIAAPGE